jgi:hypothetical protein
MVQKQGLYMFLEGNLKKKDHLINMVLGGSGIGEWLGLT